jgi:signal transduction histidine kinase
MTAWPWWAVALPSLLAGAVLAAWALQRHRRTVAALREARVEVHSLHDMLEIWYWQSDAAHRLTLLRPPGHAAGAPEAGPSPALWERFEAVDVAALRSRLDGGAPLQDVQVRFRRGRGEAPRAALLRGRRRTDERGAFAGYVGVLRETEPPAAAVPTVAPAAADPVAEADHESFSYTVSHDLRAPIRVVEGFTKILKEDYGRQLDRIGNDHLDRVLGAAARMNSMIDALLALSKLSAQPLARQPVNLSQLAGYVAEDLRRQSPGREVTLHIEPELQVMGDPTLLRLVLENLLGNAWKYTGKSRAPEVWLERRAQHPDTFTVRDNGAGFDMRFADRLFGVFQRLHSTSDFQGTGIGLATVRRIIRRHGGEVWAEAEVDRGASFHFRLPSR